MDRWQASSYPKLEVRGSGRSLRRRVEVQSALEPGAGRLRAGRIEHLRDAAGLDDLPGVQEEEVVAEAPRLPPVLGDQDDGDPTPVRPADQLFDRVGGSGIEARGGLVEEEHPGVAGERAGNREALLLAPRQDARGPVREIAQACPVDRLRFPRRAFRSAYPRTERAKRRLARADRRSMTGR